MFVKDIRRCGMIVVWVSMLNAYDVWKRVHALLKFKMDTLCVIEWRIFGPILNVLQKKPDDLF